MIQVHAQHLYALGAGAYKGNNCSSTAKGLCLTAVLLPELRVSDRYVKRMFQHFQRALGRELLPDGCHVHWYVLVLPDMHLPAIVNDRGGETRRPHQGYP